MKLRTVSGFVVSFVFHALLILLLPGLQPVEWEASPPESLEVTYHTNWQQAESIPEQPEGPKEPEPEPAPDQPEQEPEDEPEPQEPEEQEPEDPVEPEPEPEEPDEPQEAQEAEQPQEPEQEPEIEDPQPEPVEQPTETEPEGEPEPVEEPDPDPVEPERELIDPGELAAGEVDPAPAEGQSMDRQLMEREVRFARADGEEAPTQQQRQARAELLELIEETAAGDADLERMMESGQPLTLKAVEPEEEPEDPSRQPVVFELPTPGEEVVDADEEAPASPSPQDRITDRRALHQPLPEMPAWLEEEGTSVRVLVEFEVNEEGEVQRQKLRSSSGYPELDDQVLSKVAEWRYEPGPSGDTRLVAFRFELRPGGGVEPGTES